MQGKNRLDSQMQIEIRGQDLLHLPLNPPKKQTYPVSIINFHSAERTGGEMERAGCSQVLAYCLRKKSVWGGEQIEGNSQHAK